VRAAILVESNQPLVVDDLDLPTLQAGQVLVRMQYAAICGAQIGEIAASKGPDKYLPHLLGHEGVGTVEAIGAGVTTKRVGDRVICHWRPSQGIAAPGAVYGWKGTPVNSGPMTCFSTETIVSENRLTLLPEGIDDKVAPLYGCAFTTAYGVIVNDAKVKPGDSVLIYGVGGVGMPMVTLAKAAGAGVISVYDPVCWKMEAAWASGASPVVEDSDFSGWDVAIDTTGKSEAIEACYRRTKPQGKVILVGVPRHDDPISIDSLPLHFGKVLTGSQGGDCVPHTDIPRIAELVQSGAVNFDGLVTHEVPLEQINDGLDLVRNGEAGRVLVRMDA
jgi:S-(hydroxymethyl)glutathione dehydrogenase/alcohol dehydrogenase